MDLLDRPTMIKMLDEQMKRLHDLGNADVQRLGKELERTPDDAELWFESGLAYNQSGLQYLDIAIEKARLEYFEAHPEEESEPERLDVDASQAGSMFNAALSAFDKVLELMPEYYGVQCQRGVALANMQQYEEAVKCYLKALEEDDEDFSAAYYLACAYRDMGDEAQAERYFALAKELNPDDDVQTNLHGMQVEG